MQHICLRHCLQWVISTDQKCLTPFVCMYQRKQRSSWPPCTATWRSTGRCTTRRSVPLKCLPSSRTTACSLSKSCSSSSGRQRWEGQYWGVHESRFYAKWEILFHLTSWSVHKLTTHLFFLLSPVKLFVGFGFPYEGPAPLEAIANGCIFLQPKFNPPHSSLNHDFFRGKPTSRKVKTLHLVFSLSNTFVF